MNHHEHILYLRTICYYISVSLFGMLDERQLEFSHQKEAYPIRIFRQFTHSYGMVAWEKPLPSVERGKPSKEEILRPGVHLYLGLGNSYRVPTEWRALSEARCLVVFLVGMVMRSQ